MRSVRYLQSLSYISRAKIEGGQVTTLSGNYNFELEIPGSVQKAEIQPVLHAKFNSSSLMGFQVIAFLRRETRNISSFIDSLKVFRVDDGSWAETFVGTLSMTESASQTFTGEANLSFLGANELSGAETYALECVFRRAKKKFYRKVYFNHLGCFDSVFRLRSGVEYLQISKLDE